MIFEWHILESPDRSDAGIVNPDINSSKTCQRRSGDPTYVLELANIGGDGQRRSAAKA